MNISSFLIDLIDSISPLCTIGFGIFAAVKDTKPKDGKLTPAGKIAIMGIIISGLITILVKSSNFYIKFQKQKLEIEALHLKDSLEKVKEEVQLIFQDSVANSLRTSLKSLSSINNKHDISLRSLDAITVQQLNTYKKTNRQILRAYYPLQPLTLYYTIEYPINQPGLKEFAARVKPLILKHYKERWGDNGRFKDSYLDTGLYSKVNLSFSPDWLPSVKNGEDKYTVRELLEDETAFQFLSNDEVGVQDLTFLSVPAGYETLYLNIPAKNKPSQEIRLGIDFEKQVITRRVTSYNPLRAGNDLLSVSSVDLVGKKLKWKSIVVKDIKWNLINLTINFSYDYNEQSGSVSDLIPNREIIIKKRQKTIEIQPNHVGFRNKSFDN